jgi:NADH-quinone oxidoreductase subunit E
VNALQEKYAKEIDAVLAKYPEDQKRSAVMPLLYIAQREGGFVTKQDMNDIGEIIGINPTEVASIVGFYSLYHDEQTGKYRIQVCTDMPCALRGAEEFLEKLCENIGIQVGETTEDGLVTIEEVKCLAGCDHAPMFQVQSETEITYHEDQTVESTLELIEKWREEEK